MRKYRRAEPVFATARGRHVDDYDDAPVRRGRRKDIIALGAAIVAIGAILTNALFLQAGPHPSPIFTNKPAAKPKPAKSAAPASVPQPATAVTTGAILPRPRPLDPAPPENAPNARKPVDVTTDIQKELARRGFYEGPTDGVHGPKTDAAIRDFEQAAGLKPGETGENLLRAIVRSNAKPGATTVAARPNDPIAELIVPPAPIPTRTAAAPTGDKRVVAVQRALSDFGYGQIKPTGILDRETQGAIEHFERGKKMPVTGQISPRLLKELSGLTGRPLE